MTINVLRLAAAALRVVPVPKPDEGDDYGFRMNAWSLSRSKLERYAGALACAAYDAARDPAQAELVASLSNNAQKPLSDTMANGRSREDFNAYQREAMRRRIERPNNERSS